MDAAVTLPPWVLDILPGLTGSQAKVMIALLYQTQADAPRFSHMNIARRSGVDRRRVPEIIHSLALLHPEFRQWDRPAPVGNRGKLSQNATVSEEVSHFATVVAPVAKVPPPVGIALEPPPPVDPRTTAYRWIAAHEPILFRYLGSSPTYAEREELVLQAEGWLSTNTLPDAETLTAAVTAAAQWCDANGRRHTIGALVVALRKPTTKQQVVQANTTTPAMQDFVREMFGKE